MKEADLTRKIKRALEDAFQGSFWIKIPGTRYLAGVPDLLGCVYGAFVAIEVKRPDSSYGVTERQAANIERIQQAGGIAFVARSVGEATEQLLRALEGRKSA
ncbi:MAG UNVERIFIED_CONTAM: VRR-NUC domain-containing protein [Thermobifida fusca]